MTLTVSLKEGTEIPSIKKGWGGGLGGDGVRNAVN